MWQLFQFPLCPFSRKVRLVLAEKGVGHELVQTDREWRLGIGALVMAGATLRVTGRLGVAAAISVRWQPAYRLDVTPAGQVGETPSWWFGLSLNYTLDGKGSSLP